MQPDLLAKKIRIILLEQKTRLKEYLDVLEEEKGDLDTDNPDRLNQHIALERNIVDELNSFKKILDPLELIYKESPYKKSDDLQKLKVTISKLSNKVENKRNINKKKLDIILDDIKVKLENLNTVEKTKISSMYNNIDSRVLDISG